MAATQFRPSLAREWLVGCLSCALVIAPFGCQWESLLNSSPDGDTTDGPTLDKTSVGLFVSDDLSDTLVAGARNSAGDMFFVFGTRTSAGAIGEVDAISLETHAGERSFITFELGRPVHLQGADGSYVHITYDEVSAKRLTATARVFSAADGTSEEYTADVDLEQAVAAAARTISELTGQTLVVPEKPDASDGKWIQQAAHPLLIALAVVPLVILSQVMIVIMAQVMEVVMAAVTAALAAAVAVALAPLFLFTDLLRATMSATEETPLIDVFVELPDLPRVVIE